MHESCDENVRIYNAFPGDTDFKVIGYRVTPVFRNTEYIQRLKHQRQCLLFRSFFLQGPNLATTNVKARKGYYEVVTHILEMTKYIT